jgi:hypothetical protein
LPIELSTSLKNITLLNINSIIYTKLLFYVNPKDNNYNRETELGKLDGVKIMPILEQLKEATQLTNPWINSWKNEGKKVLGYFCSYIPEEIIYAVVLSKSIEKNLDILMELFPVIAATRLGDFTII